MERPDLEYKLKLSDGTAKVIKWTYGMQMDIQRVVPGAEEAMALVMSDVNTRDYMVRRVLTDRRDSIETVDDLVKIEDVDIDDPDMLLDLLNWIAEHLLYFFAKSASQLSRLGIQAKAMLPTQAQYELSTTGSEA